MYEIAILLTQNAPITNIINKLTQLGFTHTILLEQNTMILFLYLQNDQLIEQTIASLHIELPKYSKKSRNCSTIEINKKKADKYKHYIRIREFLDRNIKETEMYSKFKTKDRYKFLNSQQILEIDSYLREIAIYQILATIPYDGNYLFVSLKQQNYLINICPLNTFRHNSSNQQKQTLIQKWNCFVESVKQEMGEQTAFYFSFLIFLILKMSILVVLGVITFLLDEYFQYDVTKSPFEPLYAALTVLWAAYVVAEWISKQKEYQVKWRSEGKHYEKFQEKLELSLIKCLKHKNHFEISERIKMIKYSKNLDPVTGNYVQIKENLFYIYGSSLLTSLYYLVTLIIFLIISLNIRGYVPENNLIYIQQIQVPNNREVLISYSLAIFHVVIVSILNKKYKEASIATSLGEDHKSLETFERSLIVKRFSFEIFSAFFDFFFIGFVLDDIVRLKQEMIQMFMVDEIRRILTETILPQISKWQLAKEKQQIVRSIPQDQRQLICNTFSIKNDEMEKKLTSQLISCFLPKYESFDDYLEIILNFGYVCFFTSAVRMAGIVVTVFLFLEFLSDYYKIYHLYQKSFSIKCNSIGPWTRAMDIICVMSVFTNLMLFAVASDQIVKFFPSFFVEENKPIGITQSQFDEIDDFQIKLQVQQCGLLAATPLPNKSGQVTLVVVVIEHILLILIYLIKKILSLRRHWYDIYLQRKEYKKSLKE